MENSSSPLLTNECAVYTEHLTLGTAINVAKAAIVVPLYAFIFFLGFQNWKQQQSFKSASHSDIFTYHLAAFELIWLIAAGVHVLALFTASSWMLAETYYFLCFAWNGENFINVLTCVERYLAVVHPIVYMRLRNERGVRIRNVSIVCVWILSAAGSVVTNLSADAAISISFLIPFALCLLPVLFCSVSVLNALNHPGPGDGGQDKRVDPAKQRASVTVGSILIVQCFWLGGIVVSYVVNSATIVSRHVRCLMVTLVYLFNLPSASVLPLLYLYRAGKLSVFLCKTG